MDRYKMERITKEVRVEILSKNITDAKERIKEYLATAEEAVLKYEVAYATVYDHNPPAISVELNGY